MDSLPRAVVKVRVPRGPGAVEGERQLLVVLVLLTPHPEGGEHLSLHKAKKGVRIGPRLRQETNANSRHSLRTRMLCGLARLRRSPAPRACNPVPSLQARGRAQDTGGSPKGQPQGQHAGAARSSFARRLRPPRNPPAFQREQACQGRPAATQTKSEHVSCLPQTPDEVPMMQALPCFALAQAPLSKLPALKLAPHNSRFDVGNS